MKSYKSLILDKCEIEDCNETVNLHAHHIIERTQENTNNNIFNIALLCPNCHSKVHSGYIKIIGAFPSTKLPNKRTLVYEIDGKKNIDIDAPYIEFKNKSFKLYGKNNE
jgi:5-methylcytosine-specific restriction endonuclease McrA